MSDKIAALARLGNLIDGYVHYVIKLEYLLGITTEKPDRGAWPTQWGVGALVERIRATVEQMRAAYLETDGIQLEERDRFNGVSCPSDTSALIETGDVIASAWGRASSDAPGVEEFRGTIERIFNHYSGLAAGVVDRRQVVRSCNRVPADGQAADCRRHGKVG